MKTIKINLYKFNELSEDAQEKAIETNYDINVSFDWWEHTYEDAERIGAKINGFGLDRDQHCELQLTDDFKNVLQNIIKEHGEICNTHKIAKMYLTEYNKAEDEEDLNDLENLFTRDLGREYAKMLQQESEYLMTDEAVKESLEANDYDFLENGKIY